MSLFVQNGDAVGIDVTYLMCHRGGKKKKQKKLSMTVLYQQLREKSFPLRTIFVLK